MTTQPARDRNDTVESKIARTPAWRRSGAEPDYRFTFANERTFLAWVRTALAILAAGVLLDQFSSRLQPHRVIVAVAVLLCLLAAGLGASAYGRWRDNEVAMRHGRPLPHSVTLAILAAAVLVTCAVLAVLVVVSTGIV